MLGDLDEFTAAIRQFGGNGAFCAPDINTLMAAESSPGGPGTNSAFCVAVIPANKTEAAQHMNLNVPVSSSSGGGGAQGSIPQSLVGITPSLAAIGAGGMPTSPTTTVGAGAAPSAFGDNTNTQKDAFQVIVTDWAETVMLGCIDWDAMKNAPNAATYSWSHRIQLLYGAVRRGDYRVQSIGSAQEKRRTNCTVSVTFLAKGMTAPVTWEVPLVVITSDRTNAALIEKSKRIIAGLGAKLMQIQTEMVVSLYNEHQEKLKAKEELAKTRALLANGGGGVGLGGASGAGDASKGKGAAGQQKVEQRQKPVNFLNPGQRVGSKRPRGQIKIGKSNQ